MRIIAALYNWYKRRGTIIVTDPNIAKKYSTNRRIFVDVDSPQYDIAKDTLTYIAEQHGMAEFTDNGDDSAWAEYQEICNIQRKKIASYRKRQLGL